MNAKFPALICVTIPDVSVVYVWLGLYIIHLLGVAVSFDDTWLSSSTIRVVVLRVLLLGVLVGVSK